MDRIRIRGGRPLHGDIHIGGAKNAALPLMTAGMLTDDRLVLTNVPRLADIATMAALVSQHGPAVEPEGRTLSIGGPITNTEAPYDIVRKMRASILVLGPLLARVREGRVSLPGGCAIGTRPVDLHLKALEALGAEIELAAGYVRARAPDGGLRGGTITFPIVSVGATENALMAAVLARGRSEIINAARELIEKHFAPNDMAAITYTSGRTDGAQEFTSDRAALLAAIDKFQGRKLRSTVIEKADYYFSQTLKEMEVNQSDDPDSTAPPQSGTIRGPNGYSDITTDPDDFERGHRAACPAVCTARRQQE